MVVAEVEMVALGDSISVLISVVKSEKFWGEKNYRWWKNWVLKSVVWKHGGR